MLRKLFSFSLIIAALLLVSCGANENAEVHDVVFFNKIAREKKADGWVFTFVYQDYKDENADDSELLKYTFFGINVRYKYDDNYATKNVVYPKDNNPDGIYTEIIPPLFLLWGNGSAEQKADMALISSILSLLKWFSSGKRNNKVTAAYVLFVILALCICIFADTAEGKFNASVEHIYKLNMLEVITLNNTDLSEYLRTDGIVRDVVLSYSLSAPDGRLKIQDDITSIFTSPDYELSVNIIPFDKNSFKLADKLLCGSYFTGKNQIILSREMADCLYPNAPEKLLGEHIEKTLYGIGSVNFEIIGIFDYFSDAEKTYLNACGIDIATGNDYEAINYGNLFFANSLITDELKGNSEFCTSASGQRGYFFLIPTSKCAVSTTATVQK